MIPIIFVRYAPGACGTFLLTLLQTSSRVSCWNPELEELKGTPEFAGRFLNWFKTKFVSDLDNHIKHEPHHPYQLDFFSAKYPRGNDITEFELISLLKERQDHLFLDNIDKNKYTALRLNKTGIPVFGYENTVINIIADVDSRRWLHRTRWTKLFGYEDGKWISKENHPEFLKAKFKNTKFNNQYYFDCTWREFARKFIIDEPVMEIFRNAEKLLSDPSNKFCKQHFINLSTILNPELGLIKIQNLFARLELGAPDIKLLGECYAHYQETNLTPLKKFIRQ